MSKLILWTSLSVNILCLGVFLYWNLQESQATAINSSKVDHYFDELCPTVIYNKNDSVDLSFDSNGISKKKNRNFDNCINSDTKNLKLRLLYIKKCLPLFKEHIPKVKLKNRELVKSCPNYVPNFQESATVVDYDYKSIKWDNLYQTPLKKLNPLNILGYYSRNKGNIFLYYI